MKPEALSMLSTVLAEAPVMAPATGACGYTRHSRAGECLGHHASIDEALKAQRWDEASAFVRRASDGVILAAKPRRRRRGGE